MKHLIEQPERVPRAVANKKARAFLHRGLGLWSRCSLASNRNCGRGVLQALP